MLWKKSRDEGLTLSVSIWAIASSASTLSPGSVPIIRRIRYVAVSTEIFQLICKYKVGSKIRKFIDEKCMLQ